MGSEKVIVCDAKAIAHFFVARNLDLSPYIGHEDGYRGIREHHIISVSRSIII